MSEHVIVHRYLCRRPTPVLNSERVDVAIRSRAQRDDGFVLYFCWLIPTRLISTRQSLFLGLPRQKNPCCGRSFSAPFGCMTTARTVNNAMRFLHKDLPISTPLPHLHPTPVSQSSRTLIHITSLPSLITSHHKSTIPIHYPVQENPPVKPQQEWQTLPWRTHRTPLPVNHPYTKPRNSPPLLVVRTHRA